MASWRFSAFLNYGKEEERKYVLYQVMEEQDKWNQSESLNWILGSCKEASEVLLKHLEEDREDANKTGKIEVVKKEIEFLNQSIEKRKAKTK